MYDYDMVVIGGGAAGLVASGMSALLGAKTALVEEHRLGGDCTWTGCIPSKTLIHAAKIVHEARTAYRCGLIPSEALDDFAALMRHVQQVRSAVYDEADSPPNMEKLGVEVIVSHAAFADPHTLQLGDRRITSRFFVIATGSRPRVPDFPAPLLTNETLFELDQQPRRLLVLGAGPVGIEMAQAFRRLGSEVTVVDPGDRILSKDDPELTASLKTVLAEEGVTFRLGRKVVSARRQDECLLATLDDGGNLACDAILAAIGRKPRMETLGLERAGVECSSHGITVDSHCRTSQRHIYASGDVTGRYLFTHMAEHMSKVAVSNAILKLPRSIDEKHVTWGTFTAPELARVGASEPELQKSGTKYDTYRFPFSKLDRAITESQTAGLVKVLASHFGVILGAAVLGEHAGEMIAEWALAMRNGLKLKHVADTIHPYPTYALGNRRTADQWYTRQLVSPWIGLVGKLFGYRGTRTRNPEV
jgi:pyruvate/2-oxoglutarate dehydrogenase complex dihydrolipoamide dehydrogenase (E3) component